MYNVHIAPSGKQWAVRRTGAKRATKLFDTREKAMAWVWAWDNPNVRNVYVHDDGGRVVSRLRRQWVEFA